MPGRSGRSHFHQLAAIDECAVAARDVTGHVAVGYAIAMRDAERRLLVAHPNLVALGLTVELARANEAGPVLGGDHAVVRVGSETRAIHQLFVGRERNLGLAPRSVQLRDPHDRVALRIESNPELRRAGRL